jgi:hypothetical protein
MTDQAVRRVQACYSNLRHPPSAESSHAFVNNFETKHFTHCDDELHMWSIWFAIFAFRRRNLLHNRSPIKGELHHGSSQYPARLHLPLRRCHTSKHQAFDNKQKCTPTCNILSDPLQARSLFIRIYSPQMLLPVLSVLRSMCVCVSHNNAFAPRIRSSRRKGASQATPRL